MANTADAADHAARILASLPRRMHEIVAAPARETPDKIALIENDASWTYRDLHRRIGETADALAALGIRAGDRMMIVSENCIALAALLLAASRLDAWAIVVNPRLSARELDQIRDHSGARRTFFTASVSPEAGKHATRVGAVVQQVGPLQSIGVGPLDASTLPEPVVDNGDQVAILIYTSGTTGTPKGVMLSHENMMFSAGSTADIRHMTADDKLYIVLPISHIVGISLLTMTLMTGASARLVTKYDPAALVAAIAHDDITIVNGVPATYQRLLEYKTLNDLPKLDRGKLRLIAVAGAPLDLDLKTRTEKELGLSLLNGYGITECAPGISGVRLEHPRDDQAVGILMPGLEAKLLAPTGGLSASGEVGELHVRGRNVMRGYYRAPELTAKAIDSEGWFNTGDLGRFAGDVLYIVGRTKEMIIRSGFNVYPAEIEAVLNSHDAVVQSAVVGRTVEGNEEVVAFVQLLQGTPVTADELAGFVKSQLTSYKRPSEIIVLEALPATSTGKILKHKLAESLRSSNGPVLSEAVKP